MDEEIVDRVKQGNKASKSLQPLRHDSRDANSRIANTFRTNNTQLFHFYKRQVLSKTFFFKNALR